MCVCSCTVCVALHVSLFLLQTLMEKRVSPWINKKIVEYIGEPEPTLTEFICNKVWVCPVIVLFN